MATMQAHGKRLTVTLTGDSVMSMAGAMVAYTGECTFKKAPMAGGEGLSGVVKRKMTGEKLQLMVCTGTGVVEFARSATDITLVELANDTLQVEATSLLALTNGMQTRVTFTGMRGATSGGQGLWTTTVTGSGQVAILSQGPAIALEVTPNTPLTVDPDAFVACSGQLQQGFISGVSFRSVLGGGSGEEFSMQLTGQGIVWIQPVER